MLTRVRKSMTDKDKGFTLIELLVVVIIIGILSAIAIPIFLNQKAKAYDASVKADLKNYATAAESYLAGGESTYGTTLATFNNGVSPVTTQPIASKGNTFEVYISTSTTTPGYVIYGQNVNSSKAWVVSSYDGTAPKVASVATVGASSVTTAATDAGGAGTGLTYVAGASDATVPGGWTAP